MTATTSFTFSQPVTTPDQLRDILGHPGARAVQKQLATLDRHARYFIERSPFALLGTADHTGRCDVSPRGDGPGFVKILGEQTLIVPERPGNRRGDSLTNILANPRAGLLFMIPNVEETLRVNGRAMIVADADVLDQLAHEGKVPQLAIAIEPDEVFFHCAKAFRRSGLWQPESWLGRGNLPSLGQILLDQINPSDETAEDIDCSIEEGYRTRLY